MWRRGGNLGGFGFDSLDSPAVMTGPAPTDSRYVVSTSFLYIGFPQADPGLRITANIVPGPSVLGLLGIAGIGAARRKRRA